MDANAQQVVVMGRLGGLAAAIRWLRRVSRDCCELLTPRRQMALPEDGGRSMRFHGPDHASVSMSFSLRGNGEDI